MTWQTWWLFTLTETLLSLTPGPAVLLVVSTGLAHGPARALRSTAGILAANAFYFALSATSLGAALVASATLFTVIQWVGGAYLVYLGLSALLSRSSVLEAASVQRATKTRSLFLNAVVVQGANPKALLFFVAILPQFLDPRAPLAWQVAVLGVTSIAVECLVLLGYGLLAGQAARFASRPTFATITNRLAGSLLIVAGLGIVRQRQAS
jgi:homoserine/homoserine lactone efflux protein